MNIKTRIGKIHKVENKERKKFSKESLSYYAVILKQDGKIKKLLLTEAELEKAILRAEKNIEDTLEQSSISKLID